MNPPPAGPEPAAEVRLLIQALKKKKTVLLSTHILSEAQSSCDRVLIIHQGKIVADGAPDALGQQSAPAAGCGWNSKPRGGGGTGSGSDRGN